MNKVRMGNDPKLKPFHFHDPAWQTFVMRGEGNFGARPRATKKGGDKGEVSFPPSSRALRASLASEIPFPFPFERLPRRLGKVYRPCLRFALSAFLQSTALSVSCNQGRALGNDALTQ